MDNFDRKEAYEKWLKAPGKLSVSNISESDVRENMAVLLENQERMDIRKELNEDAITTSNFGSNSGEGARFSPIALALVRRSFPDLFAHKVVGVQALNSPLGLAYALRYAYDVAGVPPTGSTPGLTAFNGGSDQYEAGFKKVGEYSGYTGSTPNSALSTALTAIYNFSNSATAGQFGTGAATSVAEAWSIGAKTMPSMKLFLDKVAIEAKTRKLGASFSLESAQDLKAMQGIEIEREMLNILNYEITAELDREILGRMIQAAVNTSNGGAAPIAFNVSAADGRWSQEKFATIVNLITKMSNDIATATFRGAGNFCVVSPRVATALQAAGPQFTANTSDINASHTMAEVGSINGTIKVFRDSFAPVDYALVGYKGPGISDCGLIYSPYITGLFNRAIDPDTFGVRIGVMSRFAITDNLLGSGRYYRLATITNLDTILGA